MQDRVDIPVMHDDQHGTAIVVLAALRNAAKVTGRTLGDLRVVVSGAGAAGIAVSKMILEAGIGDLAVADSKGIVHVDRTDLNDEKRMFATISNRGAFTGSLVDALSGADVFLGLSSGKLTLEAVSVDGARRDLLRDGQPRPRGAPRHGARGRGQGRRDRALGLPEPDQQRAGLPGRLQGRHGRSGPAGSPRA